MKTFTCRLLAGTFLTAGLTSLLLAAGGTSASAADGRSLQGVWSGARFDSGRGEDPSKGVQLQLVIKGNHVAAQRLPSGAIGEGDFKLSPDGSSIDAIGTTGSYKGKNFRGVIKVQGNTLYWCTTSGGAAQQRPRDFVAGNGAYLIVVKRQQ